MKKNIAFSLLAIIALWAGWTIAYFAVENDYLVPSFIEVMKETGSVLAEADFWTAFCRTLWRTALSFVVSFAFGLLFAALACFKEGIRCFFAPIVSVLRTVPTMAVILILLLWTSPSVAPVIVSVLVLFPASYAAALASFDETMNAYGTLAKTYRVGYLKQFFQMLLPVGAPNLFKQAGSIASMGLKITVSAEVLSNTFHSIGGLMQEAKMYLEMPRLFALTILVVIAGFAIEGMFFLFRKFIVRWRA